MTGAVELGNVARVVDCEHRTAPKAEVGTEYGFSIGTRDIRAGRIDYAAAKRVDAETFDGWTRRAVPGAGDLILAREAPVGEVGFIDGTRPVCLGQRTVMIRLDQSRAHSRFVHYQLLAPAAQEWMAAHCEGSTVVHLNVSDVRRIPVDLPPLNEQRRIAEVLGALDDLIDTNERLTADAAELRKSILDAAFGVATEYHALSSIARFVNGKNFTKGADGAGRPIIRTPEVRDGVKSSTVRSSVEATDDFIARAGDLLFVWSGSLCVGRWVEDEALVNQHVFKVIPNVGVPDWYVYACLEWKLPWFLGLAADKATTMGHIQRSHLDAPVPKLSSAELEHLDARVRPLWALELDLSRENEQLRRTRDELLPLLMSGAVRVRPEGVAA